MRKMTAIATDFTVISSQKFELTAQPNFCQKDPVEVTVVTWRFEDYLMEIINETQLGVMYLLAATMLVSIVCFVLTILMNLELVREANKEQPK